MNKDLIYIRDSLAIMVWDKLDSMCYSECSEALYHFLKGKEKKIAEKAFELIKTNAIVKDGDLVAIPVKAMDGLNYDLIDDWSLYDEFENVEELDDDIIDKCSEKTMREIVYDCLYNYDALWMRAIYLCFPDNVTNVQCGYGIIELI